jgi:hypothetical protein
MASDNEILFLVLKQFTRLGKTRLVGPVKVARTRKEAREYAAVQRKKTKRYTYKVMPASWV